jgi:predicted peroxiredoxin
LDGAAEHHATPLKGGAPLRGVLASGPEDASKRATLAFSAACTALSLDLDTQVFLIDYGSR